ERIEASTVSMQMKRFRFLLTVSFFFFFQAEDGIRDRTVTGVQTCALPISRPPALSKRANASTSDAKSVPALPRKTSMPRSFSSSRYASAVVSGCSVREPMHEPPVGRILPPAHLSRHESLHRGHFRRPHVTVPGFPRRA